MILLHDNPSLMVPLALLFGIAGSFELIHFLQTDASSPWLMMHMLGISYCLGGCLVAGMMDVSDWLRGHIRD